jgi:hypothetical protein
MCNLFCKIVAQIATPTAQNNLDFVGISIQKEVVGAREIGTYASEPNGTVGTMSSRKGWSGGFNNEDRIKYPTSTLKINVVYCII